MSLFHGAAPLPGTREPVARSKAQIPPRLKDGGSSHQRGGVEMPLPKTARIIWKFLFSGDHRVPDGPLPVMRTDPASFNGGGNRLDVTWLGHSSLMINIDGYKVLTDPVFSKRLTPIGPTRFSFSPNLPLNLDQLGQVDVVIISHNHYDHLNKASVRRLIPKTRMFIVPLAVGAQLARWGVPRQRIVELDWWEEYRPDDSLKVVAAPARHFSGRGLGDRNKTLWASWVISGPGHKIFFSGDSGYFPGFRRIGEKFGPFDMTFLECGAYDRMWSDIHMLPEETARAHQDLRGDVLLPVHCATFKLAFHPWYEPMERIAAAARESNIRLATPVMGETIRYGGDLPTKKWWRRAMPIK